MMRTLIWWTLFLGATYTLSRVFEASRLLTSESATGHPVVFFAWLTLLVALVVLLGYEAYSKAKGEGKLVHRVWLFEKMYQFQHQETVR